MTILPYRAQDLTTERAVEIAQGPDGAFEVRVMPPRHRPRRPWPLLAISAHRWNAHSAHRWIASLQGLQRERLSPAGLLRSSFVPRPDILDVYVVEEHSLGHPRYLVLKRRDAHETHFQGLPPDDLAAIVSALRLGLGLP